MADNRDKELLMPDETKVTTAPGECIDCGAIADHASWCPTKRSQAEVRYVAALTTILDTLHEVLDALDGKRGTDVAARLEEAMGVAHEALNGPSGTATSRAEKIEQRVRDSFDPGEPRSVTAARLASAYPRRDGAWIVYYSDWSGSPSIFAEEIDALRFAYSHSMTVQFVMWGESVSDAEKRERADREAAS